MFAFHKKEYGKENKKVIFLLAGWGNTIKDFSPVSSILSLFGYHCITYAYDPSILNPHVDETIAHVFAIRDIILKDIQYVTAKGKIPFAIFGTSLGTVIALLVAGKSKSIKKVILNLSGATIGDSIWGWGDTMFPEFHESFRKNNITLFKLRKKWRPINPIESIHSLKKKDILLYVAKKDDIIPYSQAKMLIREMKRKNISFTLHANYYLNHYWSAFANLFYFPRYIRFLKKV